MKILILTNHLITLYKFRIELIEKLSRNNEVYISAPTFVDAENSLDFKKLGCKIIPTNFDRQGMNPFKDGLLLLKYLKIIKKYQPKIVLTYTVKPNVYAGIACLLLKTPTLVNITGVGAALENKGIINLIVTNLYKLALKSAKCVFFQNDDNLQMFLEKNIIKDRYKRIPGSGVNLNHYKLLEYPKENKVISFIFIGRIIKSKGILELLKATKMIKEQHPNIEMHLLGSYDDLELKEALETAEKVGLITYHGKQNEVVSFLKKAHCIVLPSYFEGVPNVLLEAAASGRAIISSRIPGSVDTFIEGISGFGCQVKNPKDLADAMIKFINLPLEQKKQMGLAGRKHVETHFNRQIVIDAYMDEISL
jgi:glycosyltransferase involved in cell wall biosynthesis